MRLSAIFFSLALVFLRLHSSASQSASSGRSSKRSTRASSINSSRPSRSIPIRCWRKCSWRPPIRWNRAGQRWAKTNKSLKGDALTAALDKQDWDASVKQLVSTPTVLAMMNDKLD